MLQFDTDFLRVGDLCRNKLSRISSLENSLLQSNEEREIMKLELEQAVNQVGIFKTLYKEIETELKM